MTRFKISPVFGVIIMVVITVILAGAVAWFVFGVSGNIQKVDNTPAVVYTGMVLVKDSKIQQITFVDEGERDTKILTVKENSVFNSIQTFKRYEISVRSNQVISAKGL